LYEVFLLNVIAGLDPEIALRASRVPFVCVECLAEELRIRRVKVEDVGGGYLFIVRQP